MTKQSRKESRLDSDMNPSMETPEQAKKSSRIRRIKCSWTTCSSRAWFEDWKGARYCPYHIYYNTRWGGGRIWWEIKNIRLYFGGF